MKLINKFIACSICAGYGHDTGRSQISDAVIGDLESSALQISKAEGGVRELLDLLTHDSHWVQFHAAGVLINLFPQLAECDKSVAANTLRRLLSVDGIVALSAKVALGLYKSRSGFD